MKNRKFVNMDYAFFDRTGIQNYLEKMAFRGWLIKDASRPRWKFVRIEPRKLHFSVCYFPKKTSDSMEEAQRREDFIAYCRHSGWELAAQSNSMLIWYHSAENPVPIETDAAMELDAIHKCARKEYLPLRYIHVFFLLVLAGVFLSSALNGVLIRDPFSVSVANWIIIIAPMGLWYGYELIIYYKWRRKAIQAVRNNRDFVETKSYPLVVKVMRGLYLLVCTCYFSFICHVPFVYAAIGVCVAVLAGQCIQDLVIVCDEEDENGSPARNGWKLAAKFSLLLLALLISVFVAGIFLYFLGK